MSHTLDAAQLEAIADDFARKTGLHRSEFMVRPSGGVSVPADHKLGKFHLHPYVRFEIVERFLAGEEKAVIAASVGLTEMGIYKLLARAEKAGVSLPRLRHPISSEERNAALDFWAEGKTDKAIADDLNIKVGRVVGIIARARKDGDQRATRRYAA